MLPDSEDDTQFVVAVSRAMALLEAFPPGGQPLRNGDLTERTNLSKATVSRLAYTLLRLGYLTYDADTQLYELGPGAMGLGATALSRVQVPALARPLMREMAAIGFNTGLGVRDGNEMLYIDAFDGSALLSLRLLPGSRIPILSSAMGRAYLAALEEDDRDALVDTLCRESGTDVSEARAQVQKGVEEYLEFGYCLSLGEWHSDINGVAAPINVEREQRIYVANVGGPAHMLTESRIVGELGPKVAELADMLRNTLEPLRTDDRRPAARTPTPRESAG